MLSRIRSLLVTAIVVAMLGVAYPAVAQQIRNQPQASTTTLSAWNSATSLNATQTIFGPGDAGFEAVAIQLTQTTTITGGAVTLEFSFDNTNFSTIPADAVHDPTSTSWAQISLPYTLQASTNKLLVVHTKGWQALRIKLSTALTGTGSVTPNITFLPTMPVSDVIALSPAAANFLATVVPGNATGSTVPTGAYYVGGNGTGNLKGWITCDNTSIQNGITASTQLVAASGSTTVYVCGFAVTGASTTLNTVKLVYGTGAVCATSPSDMSLQVPIQAAASTGPYGATFTPPPNVLWKTTASQALCVNLSAAQAVNVQVWYTQF